MKSRKCLQCRRPVESPGGGRPRIYCSDACRQAAARKRESAKNVAALTQSKSNDWYTPVRYVEAARRVLGGIDLDPASCAEANQTVQAARYFTEADDGLAQEWKGRVWLNPPYGRMAGGFIARLASQYEAGHVSAAVTLVSASAPSTSWFQPLWNAVLCFTDHRIHFNGVKGNTTGSIFAYLGPHGDVFAEEFQQFGAVVIRWGN